MSTIPKDLFVSIVFSNIVYSHHFTVRSGGITSRDARPNSVFPHFLLHLSNQTKAKITKRDFSHTFYLSITYHVLHNENLVQILMEAPILQYVLTTFVKHKFHNILVIQYNDIDIIRTST